MSATEKKVTRTTTSDPARWRAVADRDAASDGSFVYAVTTTGVYCRPSCSSRRPRAKNVVFFDTPEAAERAGFRACRRCGPDGPQAGERRAEVVAELCRHVASLDVPPTVADLARRAGWSVSHLSRVFRHVTGLSPKQYIAGRRAARVRAELARNGSITDAMYAAGYNSSGRFYEDADGALGMTPGAYRRGGAGERIHVALGSTSLGAILVACTNRGVCAVSLGDDPDALLREFQDRFPRAEIVAGAGPFDEWVGRTVALVERPAAGVSLPLDLRGTAFQQRVWNALKRIPCGQVASYGEIARAVGAKQASRAVAAACAANPVAVAIPCHRVVRRDGSLSGYRWGVERKRALLDRERPGP